MSGPEWERVKVIFEAALGVAEEERPDFLKTACSTDPDLYPTILELLRNYTETSLSAHPASTGSFPHVFQSGDLVAGRFRIIRFIDHGGMGEVYECHDELLGARQALKTLRPELSADRRAVARFKREIQVARSVSHQNVCRLYEFAEHQLPSGRFIPCLTMEFIEGETLAKYLQRARPLPMEVALPIIRQAASGLEALHARGILHRDLKPSNLMLTTDSDQSSRVVLMDFGLSKGADAVDDLTESSLGIHAGAPYFMAPEQLRGQRPTASSDIYAFGLVVDEMVTRARAWPSDSLQVLYYAKLWEKPISPIERSDHISADWAAAILRSLDPVPAERFASASDFVEALARSPAGATSILKRRVRLARRVVRANRWSIACLSVFFCALAVSGILLAPAEPVAIYNIENRTGDAGYNYLAAGLTSDITRRLGRVDGIRSIPLHRTSKQQQSLHDRFSLDGKLEPDHGRATLRVVMNDTKHPASPIWSEAFPPERLSNSIGVESNILAAIVSHLEGADLTSGPVLFLRLEPPLALIAHGWERIAGKDSPTSKAATSNNRALDDFMRGRQLVEQMSPDDVRNGLGLLDRAVSEDPSFALAYSGLANASFTMMNWNYIPQATLLANARSFAYTATSLDPSLPEAVEARALVRQHEWDWNGAQQDYLRALSLKPGFALARRHYAILLTQTGRIEEGVRESQRALTDDPYDQSALPGHALILYISGRLEEAVRILEPAAARNVLSACRNLGETFALLGEKSNGHLRDDYFRKALEESEKVRQIEAHSRAGGPDFTPEADRMFAHFLAMQGNRSATEPYVARLQHYLQTEAISPAMVAWVYTALGRDDEAFDLLEQAVRAKDRHMLFVKTYPFLNRLHGSPRFRKILEEMRLNSTNPLQRSTT